MVKIVILLFQLFNLFQLLQSLNLCICNHTYSLKMDDSGGKVTAAADDDFVPNGVGALDGSGGNILALDDNADDFRLPFTPFSSSVVTPASD